jgi:hypothetical protein
MRKQLDSRIPILINNNVKSNHRSFIVLVGDKGRDQVCDQPALSLLSGRSYMHADREPPLLALASPCVSATFGAMVLQEGAGLY